MWRYKHSNFLSILILSLAVADASAAVADRVTRPVSNNQTRVLTGHLHGQAQPRFDRGPVQAALHMDYMMLMVQPSAVQQGELDRLLADQQNPSSPHYRQWLAPEEFGNRFGLSPADHSKVVAWLTSEGFTVNQSGRGRNWIAFSGTAGQVSRSLRTPIHRFVVNGETHYANTAEPSVPDALADVIGGVMGLNDFHLPSLVRQVSPEYNSGSSHYVAPADLATIYNLTPLYQAGFDGAGQSIAVVGESNVPLSDIRSFRTRFGLPANDPKYLLYSSTDPGYNSTQIEGDLDLEWAGAIAPKATIYYVYGPNALTAIVSAVNLNIAPIITVSYGGCEIGWRLNYWRSVAQQANAQGITILNSSGDSGAAGCDPQGRMPFAADGRMVSFPAVLPEITAVGGTQFMEGSGTYWASANSTTLGSALSYIPEAAWNESSISGLGSTGGGASVIYSKPLWQTGAGVPDDNARDIPDISLSAAGHDAYSINYNGLNTFVAGTSASAPSMAGIVAILNQYQVSKGFLTQPGLGNINPQLYRLAQSAPTVFHDVTAGNNSVNCVQGSPDCLTGSFGYAAGPGYDLATGLGSVDANNLVTLWNTQANGSTVSLFVNTARATLNDTVGMTATVAAAAGGGTPTGTVNFSANGVKLGASPLHAVGAQQQADLFFPAYVMGGTGIFTIVAQYSGDTSFSGGGVTKSLQITVPVGAAGIIPTAPDTVWPSDPDAQGLAWQTTLTFRETAGVPANITGFTIDGVAQPLAQYFPSPEIPPAGIVSASVVLRNLATPTTRTFGVTGVDVNGLTWSRQITVNYLSLPPGSNPVVSATPLVVAQNPNADPNCQWQVQLNVDEAGGNVGVVENLLTVGGVDWTSRISALFGTVRLAQWAGLQGTVCLGGVVPPATEKIQVGSTESGISIVQGLTVSLVGPAANPTQLSAVPASLTMNSAAAGSPAKATLSVNLGDKTAAWTASIFPANRTTAWLGASQFSGTGSAQVTLTASGSGFAPGAYRATLVLQSASAVPQTVNVPILFVLGDNGGMSISAVANPFAYGAGVSPGMVVAIFGTNLANDSNTAAGSPLSYSLSGVSATVNGVAAPLVYVSPTQVNIQIPYEAGAGQSVLGINNNGQIAGFPLVISAAGPALLADGDGNLLPSPTVLQGGPATLLLVGAGEVSNLIRTAYAPTSATTYKPMLPLAVTVGGVPAFLQSMGLIPGQFGVTQVKFTLPATVPVGVQPVVVTVGGVASPPVNVTVQTPPGA